MLLTANNKRFLERAKERYGEDVEKIFDYSEVDFQRVKLPIVVRCIEHDNKFKQRADTHLAGGIGCKVCRSNKAPRKKIKTTADVIALGEKIHKGLDSYEKTKFVNSRTKITVTCKKHGDYEISTGSYLTGGRCTACGVESKYLTLSDLKIAIKKAHGNKYTYDWSTYVNSSNKMRIKCPKHGWFRQRVNTHIRGFGCSACGADSKRYSSSQVLAAIKSHFRDRYTYDKFVYVRDGDPVILTCKKHGDFSKVPNELVRGNGCTSCKESKPERTMCNILMDNNIEYVQEHKLDGKRYRYDIYLPKLNVLVELDGMHHYKPITHYGGEARFAYTQARDKEKNLLAKCHGIPLIRIAYTEFNTLHKAFFRELSKIYMYRIGDEFYREFKDLPIGTILPKTTTVLDVEKYLI